MYIASPEMVNQLITRVGLNRGERGRSSLMDFALELVVIIGLPSCCKWAWLFLLLAKD